MNYKYAIEAITYEFEDKVKPKLNRPCEFEVHFNGKDFNIYGLNPLNKSFVSVSVEIKQDFSNIKEAFSEFENKWNNCNFEKNIKDTYIHYATYGAG